MTKLSDQELDIISGGVSLPPRVSEDLVNSPYALPLREFIFVEKRKGLSREMIIAEAVAKFRPFCNEIAIREYADSVLTGLEQRTSQSL